MRSLSLGPQIASGGGLVARGTIHVMRGVELSAPVQDLKKRRLGERLEVGLITSDH